MAGFLLLVEPMNAKEHRMMILPLVGAAMLCSGCGGSQPQFAEEETANEAEVQLSLSSRAGIDFFTQDVCLDAAGQVTNEDPATCPERRRNMEMDDPISYFAGKRNADTQRVLTRSNSFPVQSPTGKMRAAWPHDSSGRGSGLFDRHPTEGVDMGEADGAIASTVCTEDSAGFRQYFTRAGGVCRNEDGWRYFPLNLGQGQRGAASFSDTGIGKSCDNVQWGGGYMEWERKPVRFSNGRQLDAIVSRQAPVDLKLPEAEYFEETMFTKEYGVTYWAAWRKCTVADCQGNPRNEENCPGFPAVKVVHGTKYWVNACSESSRVISLPPSEWRATYSWPIQKEVSGSRNLLANPDFVDGKRSGWSFGSATVGTLRGEFQNTFLRVDASGAASFSSEPVVLQADDITGRQQSRFGARLWGSPGEVSVRVLAGAQGQVRVLAEGKATISETPTLFRFKGPPPEQGTKKIRLEIVGGNQVSRVNIDDAYVALIF
jgi:hypothetical protein